MVKELREKTGAGMMDCKKFLLEAKGDMEKAITLLREKGLVTAQKRAQKATDEGLVDAYIHTGSKIGVLVQVNCESDFVARNDDFKTMVRNIAMHIAAASPLYLQREDIPQNVLEQEKSIYKNQAINEGKPEKILDKIVQGRLEKYYQQSCLLEQPYVKDPDKSVRDYINEHIAIIGENIKVAKFSRFRVGE
jgi:elongation factor Ts